MSLDGFVHHFGPFEVRVFLGRSISRSIRAIRLWIHGGFDSK